MAQNTMKLETKLLLKMDHLFNSLKIEERELLSKIQAILDKAIRLKQEAEDVTRRFNNDEGVGGSEQLDQLTVEINESLNSVLEIASVFTLQKNHQTTQREGDVLKSEAKDSRGAKNVNLKVSQDKSNKKDEKRDKGSGLVLKSLKPPRCNRQIPVQIAYIKSQGEFYLHLNQDEAIRQIHDIQHKQRKMLENGTNQLLELHKGMICVGKYSEDGLWYRAEVIEVTRDSVFGQIKVLVKYVDWGNTEQLDPDRIMSLAPELGFPKAALRCSLNFDHRFFKITKESTDEFKKLVNNKQLYCSFNESVDEDGQSIYYVQLSFIDDNKQYQNVQSMLSSLEMISEDPPSS